MVRARFAALETVLAGVNDHIQPAARKLGLPFVNWRCLRTSHATWLVQAGADPKSVQGQMRHSRIATTMDIYAQCVPAAQRRAIEKLSEFANASRCMQAINSLIAGYIKQTPVH